MRKAFYKRKPVRARSHFRMVKKVKNRTKNHRKVCFFNHDL